MSLMDSLLARLGLIRMKKYGLAVSADGRLVGGPDMASDSWQSPDYLPPVAPIDLFLGDARQLVPTTPPSPQRAMARGTDAPPIALVNGPMAALAQGTQSEAQAPRAASDEEEWEWKMAMARAKAVEQAPADTASAMAMSSEDSDEWEWKMAMARAKSQPDAPPPPAPGAMAVGTAPTPRVEACSVAAPPKRPPATPKRPARITASPPTEESLRKLREQAAATRPSTPAKGSAVSPAKTATRKTPLAATSTQVGPRPVPKLGKPAGRSGKVRTPLAVARTERARSAGDDKWQGEDTIAEHTERRLPSLGGRSQATRSRSSALAKAGASTLRERRAR